MVLFPVLYYLPFAPCMNWEDIVVIWQRIALTFITLLSASLICDCAPPQSMPDMIISTNMNNTPTALTGI